jgi:hypothetical protein
VRGISKRLCFAEAFLDLLSFSVYIITSQWVLKEIREDCACFFGALLFVVVEGGVGACSYL